MLRRRNNRAATRSRKRSRRNINNASSSMSSSRNHAITKRRTIRGTTRSSRGEIVALTNENLTETVPSDSPYLTDASGYRGQAERLLIPRDEREVIEIVRAAAVNSTPLAIAGAGTGVTGGRVPRGGWIISLEKFRDLEIQSGVARAGAGVTLAEIQGAAAASKQFYAPDPTEMSASIGGTLASNASG